MSALKPALDSILPCRGRLAAATTVVCACLVVLLSACGSGGGGSPLSTGAASAAAVVAVAGQPAVQPSLAATPPAPPALPAASPAAASVPAAPGRPATTDFTRVPNVVRVRNPGSTGTAETPMQFGRVFRPGEIPTCPAVSLDAGAAAPFQADVKNRYADGSVRFAVVSVMLPPMAAGARAQLRLTDAGGCPGPAAPASTSVARLLADYPGFDVQTIVDAGAGGAASARAMLQAGAYTVWADGPVQTTFVVADHQSARFDLGTDGYRSLRPVYQVQVWHRTRQIAVRVIVEQSDTEKLQNQDYPVEIRGGRDTVGTLYRKAMVNQVYASRWTRTFWLDAAAPAELDIDHGVAYLASTGAVPNFDASVQIDALVVQDQAARWAGTPKDLYDWGWWTPYMATTGGRSDIGLFPDWLVAALYSGDARLWKMAREQTDLAGAWPMHFREGGGRAFLAAPTAAGGAARATVVSGQGRPVSVDGRPSLFLYDGNSYMSWAWTQSGDRLQPVGPIRDQSWVPDGAHQPDPWFLLYLVTGDPWYLEQLQFWAAWGFFAREPSTGRCQYAGLRREDATISHQVRGEAWLLRTRARAAWASVDGSPEQALFGRTVESALRAWEGSRIGAGAPNDTRDWFAANCRLANNPLRYWSLDGTPERAGTTDEQAAIASWQVWFLVAALGHVKELGFGAGELLSWLAPYPIGMASAPGSDYRHLSDYRTPAVKAGTGQAAYQTWADAFDSWPTWQPIWGDGNGWANQGDLTHGYTNLATAAMSFVAGEPGGAAAWDVVYRNNYMTRPWAKNPKWAILPRGR